MPLLHLNSFSPVLQNLDSGEPIIQLQDGLPRPAEYRDSLGTQLVFLKSEDNIYTLTHKTDIVLKAAAPTHYAQFLAATVPAKAAQPAAVPAAEAAAAPSTAAEASSIVAPAAAESPQADAAAQTAAATPASVVPSTAATEIDSSVAASPAGASAAQLQLEANQGAAQCSL